MENIAIITARGGSKRIPKKNIKLFLGRPILQYSIDAALQSGIFDEVMVSTDDKEIAGIAIAAGAKVPFYRTEKTANDYAATADVVEEVLETYRKIGTEFTSACCIYPTAPFITAMKLREAMEMLKEQQADSVIPVVRFSFPPQRCVIIEDNKLKPKWPENMAARSQDLEPYYHDAGQFYCIRTGAFWKQRKMIMDYTVPMVLTEMEVQDIDTQEDWTMAELKYKLVHGSKV